MTSDKEAFEDRLRRISQSRAEAFAPTGGGTGRMPSRRPKPSSKGKWALAYLVFGLACAGGATLVAAKIFTGPNALLRETVANIQGADSVAAEPGFVERLASMVFPDDSVAEEGPISFLPAAPEGWVRVTAEDAALPNALDAIKARWPQGSGVLPVEQNLGYKQLAWFLDMKATPDIEQKVLSKTGASAIYLNGQGEFLNVRLNITSEKDALGSVNDPESWIEDLAALEEKTLESGEVLERLQLGGITVTNQTMPAGKSLIVRPIGSELYAPNGLKIAVPLTNRAILRLHGLTTPAAAQTLITSINRDAIAARFD